MADWRDIDQSIREIALSLHDPDGGCILFVGSGMSAEAKLPIGRQLAEELAKGIDYPIPSSDDLAKLVQEYCAGCPRKQELQRNLEDLFCQCGLPESLALIAQYFENEHRDQRGGLVKLLKCLLEKFDSIPEAHQIALRLPFKAIYTTNYDTLLEEACKEVGRKPYTVITHDGNPREGFRIVKLHGTVGPQTDRDLIVITDEDYQNFRMNRREQLLEELKRDLGRYYVIFVGYSLQDNHFREAFHHVRRLAGRYGKRCWAVMPKFHPFQANDWAKRYKVLFIKYKTGEFFRRLQEEYERIEFGKFVLLAQAMQRIGESPKAKKRVISVDYSKVPRLAREDKTRKVSEWMAVRHNCILINLDATPSGIAKKDWWYRTFNQIAEELRHCGRTDVQATFQKLSLQREEAEQRYWGYVYKDGESKLKLREGGEIPEELKKKYISLWEDCFVNSMLDSVVEDLGALLSGTDKCLFLLLSGVERVEEECRNRLVGGLLTRLLEELGKPWNIFIGLLHDGVDLGSIIKYPRDKMLELILEE